MKINKKIIGKGWWAKGYGRGLQNKDVYLINGYAYGYYPKYAKDSFEPLQGELSNYVPLNIFNINSYQNSYYQVNPSEHKPIEL